MTVHPARTSHPTASDAPRATPAPERRPRLAGQVTALLARGPGRRPGPRPSIRTRLTMTKRPDLHTTVAIHRAQSGRDQPRPACAASPPPPDTRAPDDESQADKSQADKSQAVVSGTTPPACRLRPPITGHKHIMSVVQARSSDLVDAIAEAAQVTWSRRSLGRYLFGPTANVLGVDPDHYEWLRSSMAIFGRSFAGQRSRARFEAANEAAADMPADFDDLLTRRARDPRDDLASLLAAERSTDQERADLNANCLFFILAGHATTTTMLCAEIELCSSPIPSTWTGCDGIQRAGHSTVEEIRPYVSSITSTGVTATVHVVAAEHHVRAVTHHFLRGGQSRRCRVRGPRQV